MSMHVTWMRALAALPALAAALAAGPAAAGDPATRPAGAPALADLRAVADFGTLFDKDAGKTRIVLLLSPT